MSPNEADVHKHDCPGLAASRGNYPVRRRGTSSLEEIPNREGHPLTAVIVVGIALLLGAGLVISQLVRLRTWLGKPTPDAPPDSGEE